MSIAKGVAIAATTSAAFAAASQWLNSVQPIFTPMSAAGLGAAAGGIVSAGFGTAYAIVKDDTSINEAYLIAGLYAGGVLTAFGGVGTATASGHLEYQAKVEAQAEEQDNENPVQLSKDENGRVQSITIRAASPQTPSVG